MARLHGSGPDGGRSPCTMLTVMILRQGSIICGSCARQEDAGFTALFLSPSNLSDDLAHLTGHAFISCAIWR